MIEGAKWDSIKFLESPDNVKRALGESIGRTPSANSALGTAVCLQQGRLFYEAAEQAPVEIKPLLIFYGIVNFAKAVVLGRTSVNLESLPQSHGLSDTSGQTANLEDLTVKVKGSGTFQQFNDTVAKLSGFAIEEQHISERIFVPTAPSSDLQGKTFNLKAILRRIAEVAEIYAQTFDESPGVVGCRINRYDDLSNVITLQISRPSIFRDKPEREEAVHQLIGRFPRMKKWCLVEARVSWGESHFVFANLEKEQVAARNWSTCEQEDGYYRVRWDDQTDLGTCQQREIQGILGGVGGGFETMAPYLIEPIHGVYVADLSLYYVGMNLLSSLVRYRPNIWARSTSRLRVANENADDKALALIERFMNASLDIFPKRVVELLILRGNGGTGE